jgi:soluble lytic murein transglycosylase
VAKRVVRVTFDIVFLAAVVLASAWLLRVSIERFNRAAYPLKYEDEVMSQSEATGIPPELLFAVIRTESGFNPKAQSAVPARGLMQLTQDTFEWVRYRLHEEEDYVYEDMFTPEVNIRYGAELLRLLRDELGSDLNVLCAYHAGRSNALSWLEDPALAKDGEIVDIPFQDTRRHVKKALETKQIYQDLYNFSDLKG